MIRRPRSLAVAVAATATLLLIAVFYVTYRLDLRPVAKSGAAVKVTISMGERAPQIADQLKSLNLIRDRNAFITYVNFHNIRGLLKAGTYSLEPTLSSPEIADILAQGKTLQNRLVVPEGYTLSQIETLAGQYGISGASFEAAVAAPHTESFLASKPAGVSLEGYLFPDSYEVTPSTTASDLVDAMLTDFGTRVGPSYTQAFAAEGLTLHQGLTVASIVEREVSDSADRPIVAQIFLKRLSLGMSLGSDVTAQYASDLMGVPFSTSIDSPYNTLIHPGLPPGPICSPGLDSLDAVAHPAHTDYLYFLTGKDGKTHYATTYAEHQDNIAKYLN